MQFIILSPHCYFILASLMTDPCHLWEVFYSRMKAGWSKRQKARGNEWVPGIPIHLKLVSLFVRPAAVKGILLNLIRFSLRFDFIKCLCIDTVQVIFNEILALFLPSKQNFTFDFHVKIIQKTIRYKKHINAMIVCWPILLSWRNNLQHKTEELKNDQI